MIYDFFYHYFHNRVLWGYNRRESAGKAWYMVLSTRKNRERIFGRKNRSDDFPV